MAYNSILYEIKQFSSNQTVNERLDGPVIREVTNFREIIFYSLIHTVLFPLMHPCLPSGSQSRKFCFGANILFIIPHKFFSQCASQ